MPPKTDPFCTKLHRRIDTALLLVTIIIIALMVRASAHGQTAQPRLATADFFTSPLALFQTGYLAGANYMALLRAPLGEIQPDYAAPNSALDFSALAGLSGESKSGFALTLPINEKNSAPVAPVNLDLGSGRKSFALSASALANWSNIAGIGSTIPAYSTGFGAPASTLAAGATDSPQSQAIAAAIQNAPRYAGEPSDSPATPQSNEGGPVAPEFNRGGLLPSTSTTQPGPSVSNASSYGISPSFAKTGSSPSLAALAVPAAPDAITAATIAWINTGSSTAWYTAGNWSPSTASGAWLTTDTAQFNNTGSATTAGINMTTASLSIGAVEVTSARTRVLTIGNSAATPGTLTLNGATVNSVSNVILRNASGSILTLQDNETGTGKTMNIVLANGADNVINTDGTGGITISSSISGAGEHITFGGAGTGALTLAGTNTFTGGLTLGLGKTLNINNAAALGTGTFTINGGTIDNTSGAAIGPFTNNNAQTWNGNFTFTGGSGTTHDLNFGTGAVSLGTAAGTTRTVTTSAGTMTVGGVISNGTTANSLTKAGTGTLVLSGANAYTGATTVSAGVLNIQNDTALGTTAGGTTVSSGAALQLQGDITVGAEALSLNGTGVSTTGALRNISGDNVWQGTVTLAGATRINSDAGSLTFNTAANSITGTNLALTLGGAGDGTVGGTITTGTGALTKDGAGTWTLSGNNTFSGGLTLSAGTLIFGHNNAAGSGTLTLANGVTIQGTNGAHTITNNLSIGGNITFSGSEDLLFTAAFDQGAARTYTVNNTTEFSGAITGNDALSKSGTGTLILSGNNTIAAVTVNSGGALRVANNGALGTTAAGTTVNSGGALELIGGRTIGAEALSLNGTGVSNGGALRNVSGNNSWAGNITLADVTAAHRINSDSGTLTISGGITETGNNNSKNLTFGGAGDVTVTGAITGSNGDMLVTKDGSGTLTFGGTSANAYDGTTTVNAGTLILNKTAGVNAVAGALIIGDGTGTDTVQLNANNQIADGSAVTINSSGVFDLNGNSDAIGTLTMTAGSVTTGAGTLTLGGTVTGNAAATSATISGKLALGGNRTFTIADGAALEDMAISAVISGSNNVTKNGAGTLVFSGANTYTGSTTVSAGVLNIRNNTALGAVSGNATVSNNATLQLQDNITVGAQALTINGNGASGQTGALVNVSGTNNYGGLLTLGAAATISSDSGTLNLTNTGTITGATFGLTLTGSGDGTLASIIGTTSGTLTKTGTGTWTLSGASTYTGNTAVTDGTLTVNIGGTLGTSAGGLTVSAANGITSILNLNVDQTVASLTGTIAGTGSATINIAGAKTLTSNQSGNSQYDGVLAGAGALTKSGAGTLTLTGANTYDGSTAVTAGVLNIQNDTALGTTAAGTSVTGTAALQLQGGITVGAEVLSLNSTSATGALRNISGANVWQGTVTLAGVTRINSDAGSLTFNTAANSITGTNQNLTLGGAGNGTVAGTITTGSGTLTKDGAGTWTLSGANTYAGTTSVSAGVLNIQNDAALGTTAGGTTVSSGAALELQGGITVGAEALSLTGTGISTTGALRNISGDNVWQGTVTLAGATRINSDLGSLTFNTAANSITGTQNLTLGGTGDGTVSGTITTGTGTLTKDGLGTWTLAGANTYTGATTVSAGVLNIQNATGLGTTAAGTTVSGGATLQLQGGITVGTEALNINGNGASGQTGALVNVSGTNNYGGLLTLAGASRISSDSGTLNLTNAGTISGATFGLTLTGAGDGTLSSILGTTSGTLTKSGTGTWTLFGANTYTGATTISAGVLNIQNNTALGTVAGGTTVASGATLQLQNGITVGAEALNINGTGASGQNGALVNVSGTNTYAGLLTLAGATTVSSNSGTLNLTNAGTITGATFGLTLTGAGNGTLSSIIGTTSGALTKSGAGTWTLSGASTYTGGTTVSGGILLLGANNVLADAGALSVGTATFDFNSRTDTVGAVSLTGSGILSGTSGTLTTSGVTVSGIGNSISGGTVSGAITQNASSGLTVNGTASGSNSLASGATLAGTGTIGGAITLAGNNMLSSSGTLTGSSTLGVSGTGNAISSGAISIAGLTTVNSGAGLAVNGTLSGAGALSLSGTLSGTGTVSKLVTVNSGGHLAPGNSVGTLTLASLNLSSGAILDYEFGSGVNDFTLVTTAGGLTLNGGGFNLYQVGTTNPFSTTGTYNLFGYNGGFSGSLSNLSVLNPIFGASYTFGSTGSMITLVVGNNATVATAYWQGSIDSVWNSTSGILSNFTTDAAGTTNANQLVSAATDVFFTANSASNFSNTTLGQNFTINSLTFTGAGTSAAGAVGIGGGNTLTVNNGITVDSGSGAHTISSALVLGSSQTWTNNGSNALTVSGAIGGGSNSLTKAGAGTLVFSGANGNSYTGLTTVSAGELDLNKSAGVAIAGDLSVTGGTAKLLGNNQIATGSSVSVSSGTLAMQGFNNTVAGVQLTGGAITGTGGTLTSASNFDVQAGSVSAILGGSVGLDKTSAGLVTLTGANTYNGTTTVDAGTLLVSNSTGSATGSGAIIVNSGGTLAGNGFINAGSNAVTINGTLSPGNSAGTLTMTAGALTLTSTSTTMFNLGSSLDLIALLGGPTLTLGGTLDLILDGGFSYASTYTLFSGVGNTVGSAFASVTGYDNTNYAAMFSQVGGDYNISFEALTPVPEPSTWAAGVLTVLAVGYTQRRRLRQAAAKLGFA